MVVFRLTTKKYSDKLDGVGASLFNNRWNSKGTQIVYTSESRALALAEVVVHLSAAALPQDYVMLEIEVPITQQIRQVKESDLPLNWNAFPHILDTQKVGDDFVRHQKDLILKVPSAVVHGEHNYLLNPIHPLFKKVKILSVRDFPVDKRLF